MATTIERGTAQRPGRPSAVASEQPAEPAKSGGSKRTVFIIHGRRAARPRGCGGPALDLRVQPRVDRQRPGGRAHRPDPPEGRRLRARGADRREPLREGGRHARGAGRPRLQGAARAGRSRPRRGARGSEQSGAGGPGGGTGGAGAGERREGAMPISSGSSRWRRRTSCRSRRSTPPRRRRAQRTQAWRRPRLPCSARTPGWPRPARRATRRHSTSPTPGSPRLPRVWLSKKSVELGQLVQPGQPLMSLVAAERRVDHGEL